VNAYSGVGNNIVCAFEVMMMMVMVMMMMYKQDVILSLQVGR